MNNFMNNNGNQRPFPVEAFPPVAYNAIIEVQRNTQAPISMIASSMLGALSLAIQAQVNVCRLDGLSGPCNLFLLTIAESGERKSTVDKLFTKAIRDFEKDQAIAMEPELEKYRDEKAVWTETRKGILQAIRDNAKVGVYACEDLERELKDLEANEPIEPKVPLMIITDATPEAIAYDLHKKWPSAGIMSDEGTVVFSGRATHNLGMLNKLWDGDTLYVRRRTKESFEVKGARLTMSILVQPKTFEDYLFKQGSLARDNGNLARNLVSRPCSTQGTRFMQNAASVFWQNLKIFQAYLSEILSRPILDDEQNPLEPTLLHFSPEAQSRWLEFFNRVEADLIAGGYLADVRDGASKIADNLARIAALFHYFEGNEGDITLETMNRAAKIADWYMHEFKQLFASAPEVPIEYLDAAALEKWFFDFLRRYPGAGEIRKNVIAQLGPNQLRAHKIRRDAALYVLASQGKIMLVRRGKTTCVQLNPAFFPISQPQYHTYQHGTLLPYPNQ